jgi:homeobox protein cut-like
VAELEAEATKMTQELEEFRTESKQLKNQDLTIRRLEERARALEAQLETKVSRV